MRSTGADLQEKSLHERIRNDVERHIMSGEWPPGYRIPFEHEMTRQYACSRMTVNKALGELVQRGLIERRRRLGTFVRQPHAQSAVLEIHDIEREVQALGWFTATVSTSDACAPRVKKTARPWRLPPVPGFWNLPARILPAVFLFALRNASLMSPPFAMRNLRIFRRSGRERGC